MIVYMPIPEKCPLDNISECKKKKCHLFHVDWRSGDENCSIGYSYTHKVLSSKKNLVTDTYAEKIKCKKKENQIESVHSKIKGKDLKNSSEIPISLDKNVTLTKKGKNSSETSPIKGNNKKANIEDIMELDLPENYEHKFWDGKN